MHFKLVLLVVCAIALVACEARGFARSEEQQDDAASIDMRRYHDSEARSDFGIQELRYKPQDTYDQNTGKGRRVPNEQRPRNYRVHQQSGSQEAINGIDREENW